MPTLDLTPRTLDLKLEVGDDPTIQLTFWTDDTKTVLLDLTGYTGWAATIKTASGDSATWTVDASQQASSVIVLQLDGDLVRGFASRGTRWDVKVIDADAREVTLIQGRVTFRQDVTV